MRNALIAGLLMAASPALACNEDMIAVDDWTVEENAELGPNAGAHDVTITYRHAGDRAFRMIQATVYFRDELNQEIGRAFVNPDLGLEPGETATSTRVSSSSDFDRIPDMHPDNVTVTACVRGVVYEDGKTERFN